VHDHAAHVAAAGGRGHVQGRDDQVGVVPLGHRVAGQAAGEEIDDRRQVQLALAGFDPGEIARPDETGLCGGEVPAHEVRGGRPPARPRQRPAAAHRPSGQPEFGHDLRDRVHRYSPASARRLDEHLR
jgi:hypothetical protein